MTDICTRFIDHFDKQIHVSSKQAHSKKIDQTFIIQLSAAKSTMFNPDRKMTLYLNKHFSVGIINRQSS